STRARSRAVQFLDDLLEIIPVTGHAVSMTCRKPLTNERWPPDRAMGALVSPIFAQLSGFGRADDRARFEYRSFHNCSLGIAIRSHAEPGITAAGPASQSVLEGG